MSVYREGKDTKESLVMLESRVTEDSLDHLAALDLLDHLEKRDLMANLEYLVYQEILVLRDMVVHLDHVDSQEFLDVT